MTDDQTVIVTVSPEDDAVAVEVAPSEVEQISVEVLPADGGVVVTGDLNVDLTSTNALIAATNTALAEPLHVIVDSSAAAAGLTDDQLRAAPVVVHLDEAIQGQSDGLTDAQLRASAVEVHVANQAPATDVSGLATSAGQDTAHLDHLALLAQLAAGLGVTVANPGDGLTDDQLRAAPVVVHLDEAIQGQSDGLTDAQLRASAVEVHVANQAPATDVSALATGAGQAVNHADLAEILTQLVTGLDVTVSNPSDTSGLATETSLAALVQSIGSDQDGLTLAQLLNYLVNYASQTSQAAGDTARGTTQQYLVLDPYDSHPQTTVELLARLVVAAEGQSGAVLHTETTEPLGAYQTFYGPARFAPAGAAYWTVQVMSYGAGCAIEIQHCDNLPELNPDEFGGGFWPVRKQPTGESGSSINETDGNSPLTVTVRRTGTWYRVVQTNNSDTAQVYNRVTSAFTGA